VEELVRTYGPKFIDGLIETLTLSAAAGITATVLGVLLAAMRVSPVPVLRGVGTVYVNIVRNTPLTLVFLGMTAALPVLDVQFTQFDRLGYDTFFVFSALALALYTSCFVSEAVRSGINAVPTGQAEAARAIGMTFSQTLRMVVLPQALRTVLPPLASVYIAMIKNSAIAEFFGVAELTKVFDDLARDDPQFIYAGFFGVAAAYLLVNLAVSGVFSFLEHRLAVAR
jgi:glutamate transport system permease protein